MEKFILNEISFTVDNSMLLNKLKLEPDSEDAQTVISLAKDAESIAKPKVLYRDCYIESRGEDHIIVEGVELKSKILSLNTKNIYRVFPYIATCGLELHDWVNSMDDILYKYWAETICVLALNRAVEAFNKHLNSYFKLGKSSSMNPGSLDDWPLEQQQKLFAILGDPRKDIGVELTDSFLMVPFKSVSGVIFPSEADFVNCKLCERKNCPGRRAPFEAEFAAGYING